jgi:hypothetical protein
MPRGACVAFSSFFRCFLFAQADGGGVKADLSGKKVRLVGLDNATFEVAREVAELSKKIKSTLSENAAEEEEGSDDEDAAHVPEVTLWNISGPCLAKAIAFLEYHRTTPYNTVDKPLTSNQLDVLYTDAFDKVNACLATPAPRFAGKPAVTPAVTHTSRRLLNARRTRASAHRVRMRHVCCLVENPHGALRARIVLHGVHRRKIHVVRPPPHSCRTP